MTAAEYHAKVSTFDADRIQALIDQIPKNINPTGPLFKKRCKEIRDKHEKLRIINSSSGNSYSRTRCC